MDSDSEDDNQNDNDIDDAHEQTYTIEKLIARRLNEKNEIEYRVKWKDYEIAENTWEPLFRLIQDRCFQFIFKYENLSLSKKEELFDLYNGVDNELTKYSKKAISDLETNEEIIKFKEDYVDFNQNFREFFKQCEYGNLYDDKIKEVFPVQNKNSKYMFMEVHFEKREGEDKEKLYRVYPQEVIRIVDKENFYKAFEKF